MFVYPLVSIFQLSIIQITRNWHKLGLEIFFMYESLKGSIDQNSSRYDLLFLSDYFSIHEFISHVSERTKFKSKITSQFCVNLPRKGFFTYKAFRQDCLEHNSRVLVEKPGTEFRLTQEEAGIGVCTVIHFSDKGFNAIKNSFQIEKISFFNNEVKHCAIFGLSPATDYLHYNLLNHLKTLAPIQFQVDLMVCDIIENIFSHWVELPRLHFTTEKTKYNHLLIVEKAKEFLIANMSSDINLSILARHCCVSPFHLIRLFKHICHYSPFYYLQQVRLKYAQTLLTTTELPITDICFRSGFTRLDYFSSAFSKQFSVSPSKYKALKSSII